MKNYRYEKGRYKEDSTKGKALTQPRTYKGDSLVQAWVDRRKLAVLSLWLDQGGYNTIHLSDVIKFTIDEVVAGLIEQGVVDKVEFTADATEILKKYRADLNPGSRGLRNLHHNLVLDSMRQTNTFEYEVGRRVTGNTMSEKARSWVDKAVEKYHEIEENENRAARNENIEEQKQAALKSNKVVVVNEGDSRPADHPVDVEESMKRTREYDDKLDEMP